MSVVNGYEILEDVTFADVAVRITGGSIEEICNSAAKAVVGIMLENPHSVAPLREIQMEVQEKSQDMLLYAFLDELLFLKDSENMLFLPVEISVEKINEGYALACSAAGEMIDHRKHRVIVDIKAVTMHRLKIVRLKEDYIATVVFDV